MASLWGTESGRVMPLKLFHAYLRLLRFDDHKSRLVRHAMGKLAAMREGWDKRAERLPCLYNPRSDVTVDEQLVPFRGDTFFTAATGAIFTTHSSDTHADNNRLC